MRNRVNLPHGEPPGKIAGCELETPVGWGIVSDAPPPRALRDFGPDGYAEIAFSEFAAVRPMLRVEQKLHGRSSVRYAS